MWLLNRTGWLLYQLVTALVMLLVAPVLLARRGRHYLATLAGRLGFHRGKTVKGGVWIHAVSVGEVAVAATLASRLPEDLPLVVTTVTPTGQERARVLFADSGKQQAVTYLPFDLGFAVGAFFRRFAPVALILVEGDYWPLVLEAARRQGLPVAVVNGRVGERSASRLCRFPRIGARLFFEPVRCFAVQTPEDRRRLLAAGARAERIHVTGNLKFDSPQPEEKPQLEATVRGLAGGRPVLLAGSTMGGEEEQVLEAFTRLGAGRRALLVLAPRHPERFDIVERLVRDRALSCRRRSAISSRRNLGAGAEVPPSRAATVTTETSAPPELGGGDAGEATEVLILDTLGELAALYRVADAAFIGGTLVPTGGHNPLEPACFSVPIAVGPSMTNFREMAERFDRAGAWRRVADSRELAEVWDRWLEDPPAARAVGEKAAALLAANRGALKRTVALLEPLLPAR